MEKDIRQLQHTLERRNSELSSSATFSAAFRAEGRKTRKVVQAALQQVRDVIHMLKIDAQLSLPQHLDTAPKGRDCET